jgi:hypothetical protein
LWYSTSAPKFNLVEVVSGTRQHQVAVGFRNIVEQET